MPDDASDTYDTIEWLLKNIPANNGKAGIKGISYNGFLRAAYAMINCPPGAQGRIAAGSHGQMLGTAMTPIRTTAHFTWPRISAFMAPASNRADRIRNVHNNEAPDSTSERRINMTFI